MSRIVKLKWQWVTHVTRQSVERWSHKVTFWRPREAKRSIGRPRKRWIDDIVDVAGKQWMRTAKDRDEWKKLEEAYVRHWMKES